MAQGKGLVKDGVRIIQGTPQAALERATLFLYLWRVNKPDAPVETRATLSMARPSRDGYLIKELIPDMELDPHAALDKAVAIARRGEVQEIYVNADLSRLPRRSVSAHG
jgi:hypothetical protein